MDEIIEQKTQVIEPEMTVPFSQHISELVDIASRYFPPIDSAQLSAEIQNHNQRLRPLRQAVDDRYHAEHSTIREKPALLDSFRAHNAEVFETAIFYSRLFGLSDGQTHITAASAAAHDIAKAEPAPSDVPLKLKSDYSLLMHPEMGSELTRALLNEHPEWIEHTESDTVESILQAIRCHSGPIPGFIQNRLDFYNTQSTRSIQLPLLDPKHTPSLILLAADMMALGSTAGVRKIVQLREHSPHFRAEDVIKTIHDQRDTTHEVRIDSALKSAYEGAAMVREILMKSPELHTVADSTYALMSDYFQRTKKELLAP